MPGDLDAPGLVVSLGFAVATPRAAIALAAPYGHLHVHVILADAEAERIGISIVELCCHACHESIVFLFDAPVPEPAPARATELQIGFRDRHGECGAGGDAGCIARCCIGRTAEATLDFRAAVCS